MGIGASMANNMDLVLSYAKRVKFPYMLMYAESDFIVCNKAVKEWHSRTKSTEKTIHEIPNAYHELAKDPNTSHVYGHMMKFMVKRIAAKADKFGQLVGSKDIKYATKNRWYQRKRFWILLLVIYLLIGGLISIYRKKKNMFLSWPALLILAKRIK